MKQILFTLTLALITSMGWSQCSIGYTASVSGDTVTLIPYDSSSSISYNVWDAPGGSPSTQSLYVTDTATVVYNTPGTYSICVTLYDSAWSCSDTFCDSITITGSGGGNLSGSVSTTSESCGNCNGTATASVSGGVGPYFYYWSNGDTSQVITGLCTGAYSVSIFDSNGDTAFAGDSVYNSGSNLNVNLGGNVNACAGDSIMLDATLNFGVNTYLWSNGATTSTIAVTQSGMYGVTVTDSSGCSGSDSVLVTISNAPSITASATNETCSSCCNGTASVSATGNALSYTWSNGSNSTTLTGLCPGTYSVTVEDTLTGCTSSTSVTVSAYVASCYVLSGIVDQGDDTRVYLIQEDSGSLSAVDSVTTDATGLYLFSNVCNGTYYVKAALLSSHTYYTAFLPTYYDSAALWNAATAVVVNNASNYSVDIEMIAGTNSGGAGFIGGLISQGANRGEGDPVVGVYVVAYNEDGSVAAFDRTDANGAYELTNLALGTYEVYADVLNKTAYPHQVTLSEETSESTNRDFEVIGSIIKPIAPTGLEDISATGFNVYPNPTEGFITINSGELEITTVNVLSLLGERVMAVNTANQTQNIDLDLSHMASGSYILEMNGENFTTHQSIIIK